MAAKPCKANIIRTLALVGHRRSLFSPVLKMKKISTSFYSWLDTEQRQVIKARFVSQNGTDEFGKICLLRKQTSWNIKKVQCYEELV